MGHNVRRSQVVALKAYLIPSNILRQTDSDRHCSLLSLSIGSFADDDNAPNVAVIMFKAQIKALATPLDNRLEIFNECIVSLCSYIMLQFSDFVLDKEAHYQMGAVMNITIFFMIAVNMKFIILSIFGNLKLLFLKYQNIYYARIDKNKKKYELESSESGSDHNMSKEVIQPQFDANNSFERRDDIDQIRVIPRPPTHMMVIQDEWQLRQSPLSMVVEEKQSEIVEIEHEQQSMVFQDKQSDLVEIEQEEEENKHEIQKIELDLDYLEAKRLELLQYKQKLSVSTKKRKHKTKKGGEISSPTLSKREQSPQLPPNFINNTTSQIGDKKKLKDDVLKSRYEPKHQSKKSQNSPTRAKSPKSKKGSGQKKKNKSKNNIQFM